MTYSDWREELSEGVKTRLLMKSLKGAGKLAAKLGKKLTSSIDDIGTTKASGRIIRRNRDKSGVSGKSLERRVQDRNRKQNPNIASPSTDAKQLISKKEEGEYVPPTKEISKKIYDILKKLNEDTMAAPTNNVGDGKIAGTVEAGDDPPVKKKKKKGKKKRYIYGGRGSRKMWMK